MEFVPKKVFFVKGKGYHKSKLASLELALRNAGIEKFNLVKVTSILPPNCEEVSQEKGLAALNAGQIVFLVLSQISNNVFNTLISASIGIAKPEDHNCYGYFSEYHSVGEKPEETGRIAKDLAKEMLETTLGSPCKVDARNITESGTVKLAGEWLSIIAAAVFIL